MIMFPGIHVRCSYSTTHINVHAAADDTSEHGTVPQERRRLLSSPRGRRLLLDKPRTMCTMQLRVKRNCSAAVSAGQCHLPAGAPQGRGRGAAFHAACLRIRCVYGCVAQLDGQVKRLICNVVRAFISCVNRSKNATSQDQCNACCSSLKPRLTMA